MRAIRISTTGGAEVMGVEEVPDPTPGAGEILVEVAVAGVNFIDTYFRSGLYPTPLPSGLGREGAGVVVAVGPEVTNRAVGDRVAWFDTHNVSYAQLAALPADRAVRVPEAIDFDVAGAVMLQGLTAHYLSHSTAELGPDDTVLLYAAAGGVGQLLLQMAKRRGARVLACTSTPEKAARVTELGADEVIFYRDVDIEQEVARLTDGVGVDVVYDSVGRDTFDRSLGCVRERGLVVLYGASSGPVDPVDPQRLNKHGSIYLTRPALTHYTTTVEELEQRAAEVFDLLGTGGLEVAVHGRYPLADAADAHRDLESGRTAGKLLLVP